MARDDACASRMEIDNQANKKSKSESLRVTINSRLRLGSRKGPRKRYDGIETSDVQRYDEIHVENDYQGLDAKKPRSHDSRHKAAKQTSGKMLLAPHHTSLKQGATPTQDRLHLHRNHTINMRGVVGTRVGAGRDAHEHEQLQSNSSDSQAVLAGVVRARVQVQERLFMSAMHSSQFAKASAKDAGTSSSRSSRGKDDYVDVGAIARTPRGAVRSTSGDSGDSSIKQRTISGLEGKFKNSSSSKSRKKAARSSKDQKKAICNTKGELEDPNSTSSEQKTASITGTKSKRARSRNNHMDGDFQRSKKRHATFTPPPRVAAYSIPRSGPEPHFRRYQEDGRLSILSPHNASGSEEDRSDAGMGADDVISDMLPRSRASETFRTRTEMARAHPRVRNVVPAITRETFRTWEELLQVVEDHSARNFLRFRTRSSLSVVAYNRKHPESSKPTTFPFVYKQFRCTHGVVQKPRGSGNRVHMYRYTGCLARFHAELTNINEMPGKPAVWRVKVVTEARTHNHPTSQAVYDSYFNASSVPLDTDVMAGVTVLANARTNNKQIATFVANELGRNITPQQTRNIVSRLVGESTAEARLRNVLHAYVQHEGNDVLLLQDQLNVTCAVVLQSALQKRCYAAWGQSLCMDFTHGTNNLGYHLGSFVATTPTGRGIPILDFIALNEQASTLEHIFSFFKAKNPTWSSTLSFIIDKDFVEWRVLEKCFPSATVLLCQFHALSYWSKETAKSTYNLRMEEKEDANLAFASMLYSSTEDAYNRQYESFKVYCTTHSPRLFEYFTKNWHGCRAMWSNHLRMCTFSAGNSTTNRIEANWHQLKMTLGKSTRIDKTVAGLIQHHITIARQIVATLRKLAAHSRLSVLVPSFLTRASGRLSDFALAKVRDQYDHLHLDMNEAVCNNVDEDTGKWEVVLPGRIFECDVLQWRCTCLFSSANHLPCAHLLYVVRHGMRLLELPTAAVPERWSTLSARFMFELLQEAVDTLIPVLNLVRISPDTTHDGATQESLENSSKSPEGASTADSATTSATLALPKPKRVMYVRLQRKERCNAVVLSNSEKYAFAKAVFEPALENLSNLSSAAFYPALERWKQLVAKELGASGEPCSVSDTTTQVDANDSDSGSDTSTMCSAAELMEVLAVMKERENQLVNESDQMMDRVSLSQVSLPALDISEASQAILNRDETVPTAKTSSDNNTGLLEELQSHNERSDDNVEAVHPYLEPRPSGSATLTDPPAPLARNVDLLFVPSRVQKHNNAREKLTQGWDNARRRRYAVVEFKTNKSVPLLELMQWAKAASTIKSVANVLSAYPESMTEPFLQSRWPKCTWEPVDPTNYEFDFIIPKSHVRKMLCAIKDSAAKPMLSDGKELNMLISYKSDMPSFSRRYAFLMQEFYDVKKRCKHWQQDMKWLNEDWTLTPGINVEIFEDEIFKVNEVEGGLKARITPDQVRVANQACAEEVVATIAAASLNTTFRCGGASIPVAEIVGYAACDRKLNDSVLNYTMELICGLGEERMAINSHCVKTAFPRPPQKLLTEMNWVLLPLFLAASHWGLIAVRIYSKTITANFYEPLCSTAYRKTMKQVYYDKFLPFVQTWHVRDNLGDFQYDFKERWVLKPRQPDATSCGVLVLGMAYAMVSCRFGLEWTAVSATYVRVMRLRILWAIVNRSKVVPVATDIQERTQRTKRRLEACFIKGTEKLW